MNRIKTIEYFCITVAAVLLSVGFNFLLTQKHTNKTGYINVKEVYDGFQLKKELGASLDKSTNMRIAILDSLKLEFELLASQLETSSNNTPELQNKYKRLGEEIYLKQQTFEEDRQLLVQKYDEQVWQQLNQYIQDYSTENGYTYLYGVAGLGGIMAADPNNDITEQVIVYANNKYHGIE